MSPRFSRHLNPYSSCCRSLTPLWFPQSQSLLPHAAACQLLPALRDQLLLQLHCKGIKNNLVNMMRVPIAARRDLALTLSQRLSTTPKIQPPRPSQSSTPNHHGTFPCLSRKPSFVLNMRSTKRLMICVGNSFGKLGILVLDGWFTRLVVGSGKSKTVGKLKRRNNSETAKPLTGFLVPAPFLLLSCHSTLCLDVGFMTLLVMETSTRTLVRIITTQGDLRSSVFISNPSDVTVNARLRLYLPPSVPGIRVARKPVLYGKAWQVEAFPSTPGQRGLP